MGDGASAPVDVAGDVAVDVAVDVTVVIPARNRAHVLARALESVAAQTRRPSKVIVVDDASEDATATVARSAGAVVLTNASRTGSGPSRNRAIVAADSRWVAFLDSDDVWRPGHLEAVLRAAQGQVLVTAPAVDSEGRLRGNVTGRPLVLTPQRCFVPDNAVVTSGTIVDRTAVLEVGMFRSLARAQDLDLWIRLLERGEGRALAEPTVGYATRGRWTTEQSDQENRDPVLQILADYADRPWMTRRVRDGLLARMQWDAMRRAVHERRLADGVRLAAWFPPRPHVLPVLAHTLVLRHRGRTASLRAQAVQE